jgi:hypothetical protein
VVGVCAVVEGGGAAAVGGVASVVWSGAAVGDGAVVRVGGVASVAAVVWVSVFVSNIHWPLAWPSRARDAGFVVS